MIRSTLLAIVSIRLIFLAHGAVMEQSPAMPRRSGNDVILQTDNVSYVLYCISNDASDIIQFDSLPEVTKTEPARYEPPLEYHTPGGTTNTSAYIDITPHPGKNVALFFSCCKCYYSSVHKLRKASSLLRMQCKSAVSQKSLFPSVASSR
jgi:hypothetical protein